MKNNSKISIVVPVYNAEKYIEATLESLVNQTLKDIEIICVNDGSSDGSLDILNKYKKKDSRIKVVSQENAGRSKARNVGLNEANSPYVMFCDSDDSFDLEMCEKMLGAIEQNGVDLAVCGINMIYNAYEEMRDSDEYYYKIRFSGRRTINEQIVTETNGSVCNKIFRVDKIREYGIQFPEGLGTAEDYYFYCVYMSVSDTIFFLNKRLYNYVRREDSTMSRNFDGDRLSTDDLMVAERIFDFYKKTGFIKKHKNLFWRQWVASFWASYRYSGKRYRDQVIKIGKEFIEKNYNRYRPSNTNIEKDVMVVAHYNGYHKLKGAIKNRLKRFYLKINHSYRQQIFINTYLDGVCEGYSVLLDRIDNLNKGE